MINVKWLAFCRVNASEKWRRVINTFIIRGSRATSVSDTDDDGNVKVGFRLDANALQVTWAIKYNFAAIANTLQCEPLSRVSKEFHAINFLLNWSVVCMRTFPFVSVSNVSCVYCACIHSQLNRMEISFKPNGTVQLLSSFHSQAWSQQKHASTMNQ